MLRNPLDGNFYQYDSEKGLFVETVPPPEYLEVVSKIDSRFIAGTNRAIFVANHDTCTVRVPFKRGRTVLDLLEIARPAALLLAQRTLLSDAPLRILLEQWPDLVSPLNWRPSPYPVELLNTPVCDKYYYRLDWSSHQGFVLSF